MIIIVCEPVLSCLLLPFKPFTYYCYSIVILACQTVYPCISLFIPPLIILMSPCGYTEYAWLISSMTRSPAHDLFEYNRPLSVHNYISLPCKGNMWEGEATTYMYLTPTYLPSHTTPRYPHDSCLSDIMSMSNGTQETCQINITLSPRIVCVESKELNWRRWYCAILVNDEHLT